MKSFGNHLALVLSGALSPATRSQPNMPPANRTATATMAVMVIF